MKRIIMVLLAFAILIPAMASAQEIPTIPEVVSWSMTPARSIIWIGEDLIVSINGTGNTSYTLEMRPLDANNTILNATYSDRRMTDLNGTDWAVIPDGYNENPGNYRIQVLVNQIVLAYADVRLEYSFERWVGIQFGKINDDMQYLNETQQAGVQRDTAIVNLIEEMQKENKMLWLGLLLVVAASIPLWLGAYKDRCETKHKRSRFIEALEGVEEDRKLYYGGSTTTPIEKRMYGGANSCKHKSDSDHNIDTCPHCALDQWAMEMGVAGMTHEQIIEYIGGGAKPNKPKVERPGYFERVALWREYSKRKKQTAKESDDKKKVKE